MKQPQIKVRDLMPEKYGNILRERTGKTRAHIYKVVNEEDTEAEIWAEVLKLAEETIEKKKTEKQRLIKLLNAA